MLTATGLGIIPDWQFSADPNINRYLNPHVNMPDGWYQATTVQPYGSSMTPIQVPIPSQLYGARLGYPMIDQVPLSGPAGWAWEHRKGLALGVVGVIGLALLGGVSAILK